MLDAPDLDSRVQAPSSELPPIGCWVTGANAEEILDTVWDDDFLLVGARLRPAFGTLVSLDEEGPAYIVELARADVEVTIQRTAADGAGVKVICKGKTGDAGESMIAVAIPEADAVRLPEAVLEASRKTRDHHSSLQQSPTTI